MIRNYLRTAWRNLFNNRTYSFINIAGLGLGLATGFIILLWVYQEYSMNMYHKNADRIYKVNATIKFGSEQTVIWENTPAPVAVFARENINDIEKAALLKINYGAKQVVKYGEKIFVEDKIGYTENPLFEIFDFPIVAGDDKKPLADGLSVVLTEKTARRYFDKDDPLGKTIRFRDTLFTVSGVMKDFPASSSIQADMLFTMDIIRLQFRGNGQWKTLEQDWGNHNYFTFCLMKKGTGTENAAQALLKTAKKAHPNSSVISFPFVPLKNLYLYKPDGTKGRIIMVEIFFIVAVFVLLIACINYVNLVTAKATQRIKEVSIRKIIGAGKKQLFWQFFTEAGVLLMLAGFIALVFGALLLPLYKQVSGNAVVYDVADWKLWKLVIVLMGTMWLLTGLYPALLLSSFRPLQSLRGNGLLVNAGLLRKSLVVLQFVVSITLLLSTVFIHRQMNYVMNKDLHVNTENVLAIPAWKIMEHAQQFKQEIAQSSYVKGVTSSNLSFFDGGNSSTDLEWPGKQADEKLVIWDIAGDQKFMKFFNTDILDGSDFSKTSPGSSDYILNETAVRKMGLKNPVGQVIKYHEQSGTVIGVVKDFHFESLHKELEPALLRYDTAESAIVYVKVPQQNTKEVIAYARKLWKKYEQQLPMEYSFLDDQLAKQYDKETRASHLFDAFSLITLLISCLGLFGLAAYSAERRTKEIGIRKVLGAEVSQLAALLSREFIVLVVVAIVIAVPLVWLGMNKLLEYFAYRISLDWWVFLITCMAAIITALATVSFQAIKAAMANPVKSLRTE